MPIVGLTDKRRLGRFPSLGKLRKGGPKGDNKPGPDLPHFRFTSPQPEVQACFEKALGKTPTSLTIFLPYEKIADNFSTWQEEWVAGGLRHRCDGVTCSLWLDKEGKYRHDPVKCPGGCKQVGRLNFFVPELLRAGYVGFVTLQTGSINDIQSIQESLWAVIDERGNEDLTGIAFTLRRVPSEISMPGKEPGKRTRRNINLVELVPAVQWVRTQLSRQKALTELPAMPDLLEAGPQQPGAIVDVTTGEVIEPVVDAEFEEEDTEDESPSGKIWLENRAWVERFLEQAIDHYRAKLPDLTEATLLAALQASSIEDIVESRVKGDKRFSAEALKKRLDAAMSKLVAKAERTPLGDEPEEVEPIQVEEQF